MPDEEMPDDLPRYYTIVEAAKMFAVQPSTVRGWVRDGDLKGAKTPGGGRWLISHEELRKFAQERLDS